VEVESVDHTPVLPRAVCELLNVGRDDVVVDATIGLGGHAALFAERLGASGTLIGIDADARSLQTAEARLAGVAPRVEFVHANFADVTRVLDSLGIPKVDVLFADLGVSSQQLDDPERGFSFQQDGPLDMRIDSRLPDAASDLVNRMGERELGDLFYYNSQEQASRRIARRVCQRRREGRITRTAQLVRIVEEVLGVHSGSRRSRIHPATRTFLALRIAVNDEIARLGDLLAAAPGLLKPGGRFGVIAFHSVEDRPVKLDFRKRKAEGIYHIVTKKPVVADSEERRSNPRSRSAKLRVALRLPAP